MRFLAGLVAASLLLLAATTVLAGAARAAAVGPGSHLGGSIAAEASPGDSRASTTIDPNQYRETLQAALADLDRGGPDVGDRVASRLRSVESVLLPDGPTIRPDLAAILADLESEPRNLDGARARLRALLDEMDRSSARSRVNWAADPRERLQRVLDRPEFRPAPELDPISKFLQQLQKTIGDQLGQLLAPVQQWLEEQWNRLWDETIGEENQRLASTLAGLILVIGLVAQVARGLRRAMGPTSAEAPGEATPAPITAEGLRADALRLARGSDFREAIRVLYLAILLRWDEQGKLRFERALTNREVLAGAERGGDRILVERLAPLVERFDRFWYGGVPCSSEDYADFALLADLAWGSP